MEVAPVKYIEWHLLRSAHTRGLVPANSPLNSLHEGTAPTNSSHEAFRETGRRDLSQKLKLRLDFEAKMTSSHDGTCPCDLMQGLVEGTSPLVCADLYWIKNHSRLSAAID